MANDSIVIDKDIVEWRYFKDDKIFRLFAYLAFNASVKSQTYKGVEISPGQIVVSVKELSINTNLTIREARTRLSKLEEDGVIEKYVTRELTSENCKNSKKVSSDCTVVTICKFAHYEDIRQVNRQVNRQVKEEEKKEENPSPTPPLKEEKKEEEGFDYEADASKSYAQTEFARGSFEYFSPKGEHLVFTPPTEQEIAEFASKNGLRYLIPQAVIERFDAEGWKNRNGRPVDWKSAAKKMNELNKPKSEEDIAFEKWMLERFPRIQQLREPLILADYRSLEQEFGTQELCNILEQMQNYQKLLSKYVSAKQTAKTWLNNRKKQNNGNNTWNGNGQRYLTKSEQAEQDRMHLFSEVARLIEERANSDYDGSL